MPAIEDDRMGCIFSGSKKHKNRRGKVLPDHKQHRKSKQNQEWRAVGKETDQALSTEDRSKKKKQKKEKPREAVTFSKADQRCVLAFYEKMQGDDWTCKDNWRTESSVSSWYGLIWDNYRLDRPQPSGTSKAATWRLLEVNLAKNNLRGILPSVIGTLGALKILNLSENALEGHLPENLSHLSSVHTLDLSMNALSGCVPLELLQLPMLECLYLQRNRFQGQLPLLTGDGNRSGSESVLEVLCLEHNRLVGEPPRGIHLRYPMLKELRLHGNNWVDAELARQRLRAEFPPDCDLTI